MSSSSAAASALKTARNAVQNSNTVGRVTSQGRVNAARSAGRGVRIPVAGSEKRIPTHVLQSSLRAKAFSKPEHSSAPSSSKPDTKASAPWLGVGRGSTAPQSRRPPSDQANGGHVPVQALEARSAAPRLGVPKQRTGLAAAVLDYSPNSNSLRGQRRSRQSSYEGSERKPRENRSSTRSLVPAALDPLHEDYRSSRTSKSMYEKELAALEDLDDLENHPAMKMRERPTHITAALKADPSVEAYRAPDESESLINVRLTEGCIKVGDEASAFAWSDLGKVVEHLPEEHWAYGYIKGVVRSVEFNGDLMAGQKERMLAVVLQTLADLSQRKEDYNRFQDAEE